MARLTAGEKKQLRKAGRMFVSAFVGSLLTLIVGGHYITVNTEGAYIPDWKLIDEMIVSATISGVIALLMWLQTLFENGNGSAGDA